MTYALVTPPAAEPLTLDDVKAHLRLSGTHEDDVLATLIVAARQYLESQTGLCLITQGFVLYLDQWPDDGVILISKSPLQVIENVTVYDDEGHPLALSLDGHILDGNANPARLFLAHLPAAQQRLNAMEINFLAGFGDSASDVPDLLKRAMLMHIAQMYELRGAVPADMQPAAVPPGYDRLVSPYQNVRL